MTAQETLTVQVLQDSSAEAILAEHERLANLYLYNAEMGEKRTALYLTVISIGTAALVSLPQFGVQIETMTMGFLTGMLVMGLLTFQRLIERRIRGTEYLRAINRTHRYFVEKDPALERFFYWPPCDDVPSFGSKGAALAGLRDIIGVLNSLIIALLLGEMVWVVTGFPQVVAVIAGIIAAAISWGLHRLYESRSLREAESSQEVYVNFPINGSVSNSSSEASSIVNAESL